MISRGDKGLAENREEVDDSIATANLTSEISKPVTPRLKKKTQVASAKTHLLHELTASTEEHSAEMLRLAVREQSLVGRALTTFDAGSPDRVEDDAAFQGGLITFDFVASDGGDDVAGIFVSLVGEQPSRALREPEHGGGHDNAEGDLESNRETPDKVGRAV